MTHESMTTSGSAVDEEELQLLKEAALVYLDQTSQLPLIKQRCEEYIHNKENVSAGVFFFMLTVNPLQIEDPLNDVVLHNPKLAKKIFQQVCLTTIQCLSLLPGDIKSSQVIVNLKITHLPPFQSYHIHPLDLAACRFDSRYYQFNGIVISMTTPTEYSQVAKYRCPVSECVGATDNQYIRLHTAGAKETNTIRRDFHCVYCGSTLIEDVNCRVLGEKVVVEMIESTCFSPENQTCVARYNQSMSVFLRDTLMEDIQIGGSYTVIGMPVKQMTTNAKVSISFEANNIYKTQTPLFSSLAGEIPTSLSDLYRDRVCSPWSFSASLAYLFGADILPPGTFHKLKLIMLLSLVDSMDKTKDTEMADRLHIYVTGKDTLAIGRLLMYGASFVDRSIRHSAGLPLMATVNKDDHGTGACSIDAMETRKLTIEIPKKYSDQSIQHLMMPVKCTVWAYGEKMANKSSVDVFAPLEPSKSSTSLLEECFSLTVSCSSSDRSKDDYAEQCLLHHTLRQAISDEDGDDQFQDAECLLDMQDLKQFLKHVSHIEVKLSVAAKRLIKGYFVASRRVRSSGVHGMPFPQAAVHTLSDLSKAHARLNMRQEVSEQDTVLAIMIYEEIVTERFGFSVLSVQPRPHFRDDNITAYIGPENDAYMQQFHMQLVRFCSSHAPDFDILEAEL
ncbi:minichromosome maintenance domain-containing protein 2-like isoform X2 [Amphiura filiformis]|uniref:minichromosome maintenance domain-containing protein 2-like isoform X2 n=1 Tax=Amphiura filiformis TaxID=82378 RepID=UPI003B216538